MSDTDVCNMKPADKDGRTVQHHRWYYLLILDSDEAHPYLSCRNSGCDVQIELPWPKHWGDGRVTVEQAKREGWEVYDA